LNNLTENYIRRQTGKYRILWIILMMAILIETGNIKTVQADTMKVKIAMCQIFCLDGDREGNFVRIRHALDEAKNAGADIACFPEMAILGWVNPDAHHKAFAIPGQDSDRLCALAKRYNIFISIGLAEKVDSDLYDSVILVDNDGNILLKHRKINILKELMTPAYTPGSEIQITATKYGQIGLLICADTFREDNLVRLADLKPDLVLIPFGWAAKEEEWPEHGKELHAVVTRTASKVAAPVVGTDLVGQISKGPWKGRTYGGQSVVADKKGNIISVARDRDRDIQVIEITLDITR
jgi:predicted amidohydrolase